jgi:predicted transcriptional regulator
LRLKQRVLRLESLYERSITIEEARAAREQIHRSLLVKLTAVLEKRDSPEIRAEANTREWEVMRRWARHHGRLPIDVNSPTVQRIRQMCAGWNPKGTRIETTTNQADETGLHAACQPNDSIFEHR